MGPTLIVTTLTTVLFVGMILLLATKAKVAGKITGTLIVIVALGGLLIYGYGYAMTVDNLALAVIRGILSVCGMFLGKNELSAISDAPLMQEQWMLLTFWLLHLLAFYMTAGAAIVSVGAEALKKLRLWMARRGQMNLIYGVNADSLELGKELVLNKNSVVIFVDGKPDASLAATATAAGCVVRSDGAALSADPKFLRGIGIGPKRHVTIYALSKDSTANLGFAQTCLKSFQVRQLPAHQLRLVILGQEDTAISQLQVTENTYGYGFVSAVNEADLAARLLVRSYPPCDCIRFDENCAATEDFEALIVGFGKMGQAVLKRIVMNARFEGSRFRAAVFAPDCQHVTGYFSCHYEALLANYDITFQPCDARSRQMFDYLRSRGKYLKYVAICTGNDKLNHEIAGELTAYFRQMGIRVPVYACSYHGVKSYGTDGEVVRTHKLYRAELLSQDCLDRMAMVINQSYHAGSGRTALENWMVCDYFSRQSCRASADFMGAMLRAAGKTDSEAQEDWNFTPKQLENLSRTEHHRWCAFHYCMGFSPMTQEEFDARSAEYRRQLATDGKATIRIAKNLPGLTHACLTDWDGLKELDRKEKAVTGKPVDYQYLDSQNVLAVPELLRAAGNVERGG